MSAVNQESTKNFHGSNMLHDKRDSITHRNRDEANTADTFRKYRFLQNI